MNKKKKILLVYPEIPMTYWSLTYTLPFTGKKAVLPPLGLMTVAALIPDNYELKLIDLNVEKLKKTDIKWADLVFISAMIIQKESFNEVVKLAKEFDKTVVAGGPYPISSHAQIPGVDHFILGEAEITLPEFFKDYESGNAKYVFNTDKKPDIKFTPVPRFDLIKKNKYLTMALQNSRGCPFNCEFCDIIEMFGRKVRTKSPDQFINEMNVIYKTGFRGSIFIVDDNFIGNIKVVKILLRKIIEWQIKHDYPFQFFTEASINIANDDELLDLLKNASFDFVFIGIETPDVDTLKSINKGNNARFNLIDSVKKIHNCGVGVSAGFILGFDTDTDDIFDRQIEFINQAAIPMAMVGMLMAMPKTQLYRRLDNEKRLINDWSGNNTHDLDLNFATKMNPDKLRDGYKKVLSTIYKPENFFERCFSVLNRMPVEKIGARKVQLMDIRALVLTFLVIPFSFYSFQFFKFLWKGLRVNRKFFPEIISMTIHGHHFIKLTKKILKLP